MTVNELDVEVDFQSNILHVDVAGDAVFTYADQQKLNSIEEGADKTIIDETLTQLGNAADAKAVGDALAGKMDTMSTITTEQIDALFA